MSSQIRLVPMAQLSEANGDDDVWTGLKDQKERRKIQNRLHQRAWRKRKARAKMGLEPCLDSEDSSEKSTSDHGPSTLRTESIAIANLPQALTDQLSQRNVVSEQGTTYNWFSAYGYHNFYEDRAGRCFTISSDHKLLTIIAHNVCRAVLINTSILAKVPTTCFASSRCCQGPRTFEISSLDLEFPPTLKPTRLQELVPHLPWIDLFPSPRLRDNLITAFMQKKVDHEELIEDLIGGVFDKGAGMEPQDDTVEDVPARDSAQDLGVVSWADPWDISGWEMTESFIMKWKFILAGCVDVIAATNKWRRIRGEKELRPKLYR